jgi:hypothetical protein
MRKIWLVGESMPLRRDGKDRAAQPTSHLPNHLVPLDPRHGVFTNLVLAPLFSGLFAWFKQGRPDLPALLGEMEAVVNDQSERRFNVFMQRITVQEENPDDLFVIDEAEVNRRLGEFQPERDLWLVFGHQTNFGLLKWL